MSKIANFAVNAATRSTTTGRSIFMEDVYVATRKTGQLGYALSAIDAVLSTNWICDTIRITVSWSDKNVSENVKDHLTKWSLGKSTKSHMDVSVHVISAIKAGKHIVVEDDMGNTIFEVNAVNTAGVAASINTAITNVKMSTIEYVDGLSDLDLMDFSSNSYEYDDLFSTTPDVDVTMEELNNITSDATELHNLMYATGRGTINWSGELSHMNGAVLFKKETANSYVFEVLPMTYLPSQGAVPSFIGDNTTSYSRTVYVPKEAFSIKAVEAFAGRDSTYNNEMLTISSYIAVAIKECMESSKDFKAMIKNMIRGRNLSYKYGEKGETYKFLAPADAALYGGKLYGTRVIPSVFGVPVLAKSGDLVGIASQTTMAQLIARTHTIVNNKADISIPNATTMVVLNIEKSNAKAADFRMFNYLVAAGVTSVHPNIIAKYGTSRVVSLRLGGKAQTQPHISEMDDMWNEIGIVPEFMLTAGNAKGNMPGVYVTALGLEPEYVYKEIAKNGGSKLKDQLKSMVKTVETKWGKIEYVIVEETFDITNLSSIEGYTWTDEFVEFAKGENQDTSKMLPIADEAIEAIKKGKSVFTFAKEKIVAESNFTATMHDMFKFKMIGFKKEKVSIRLNTLQNAFLSYGQEQGNKVLKDTVKALKTPKSMKHHFEKPSMILDVEETKGLFGFINSFFEGKSVPMKALNVGSFSNKHRVNNAQLAEMMDDFYKLFITEGTVINYTDHLNRKKSIQWDGLFNIGAFSVSFENSDGKIVQIDIPSGSAMKNDVSFVEPGNHMEGLFFGTIMQAFMGLLITHRTKKESRNLLRDEIRYNSSMSEALFRDTWGSMEGRGAFVSMLAAWWSTADMTSLYTTNPKAVKQGKVAILKSPDMFLRALMGMNVVNVSGPNSPFGQFGMTKEFVFSMMKAGFIHPVAMLTQGNDGDGDGFHIIYINTIPVFEFSMDMVGSEYWGDYVIDECSPNLWNKGNKVTIHDVSEVDPAVREAQQHKTSVGSATVGLYAVLHHVDTLVNRGVFAGIAGTDASGRQIANMTRLTLDEAQRIKETFALVIQDETVRAIKHESGDSILAGIGFKGDMRTKPANLVAASISKLGKDHAVSLSTATKFYASYMKKLGQSGVSDVYFTSKADNKFLHMIADPSFEKRGGDTLLAAMGARSAWRKLGTNFKESAMESLKAPNFAKAIESNSLEGKIKKATKFFGCGVDMATTFGQVVDNGKILPSDKDRMTCADMVYVKAFYDSKK